MGERGKSDMLYSLIEEILNDTMEEDEDDKDTVKITVKKIIKEIYGEDDFTEEDIDKALEKYFKKFDTNDEIPEDTDYTSKPEDIIKETDEIPKDTADYMNEIEDIIKETDDSDSSPYFEEEADLEIINVEDMIISFPLEMNAEDITEDKKQDNIKSEEKFEELESNGRGFNKHLSSLREKVITLWEDDSPDMLKEFRNTREELNLILSSIKNDIKKHKDLPAASDREVVNINDEILKMLEAFKESVECLLKFLENEDPTFAFSSKKIGEKGDEILNSIGEKLKNLA